MRGSPWVAVGDDAEYHGAGWERGGREAARAGAPVRLALDLIYSSA